jgi:hypothetical protein
MLPLVLSGPAVPLTPTAVRPDLSEAFDLGQEGGAAGVGDAGPQRCEQLLTLLGRWRLRAWFALRLRVVEQRFRDRLLHRRAEERLLEQLRRVRQGRVDEIEGEHDDLIGGVEQVGRWVGHGGILYMARSQSDRESRQIGAGRRG